MTTTPPQDEDDNDTGRIDASAEWADFCNAIDETDDPVRIAEEAGNFAETLAIAVSRGDTNTTVADNLLGKAAKKAGDIKKGTLEDEFGDHFAYLEDDGDADIDGDTDVYLLDKFLTDLVDGVIKYVPTDASAKARYIWVLDDNQSLETHRQHVAKNSFRDEIYDQVGIVVDGKMSDDVDTPWKTYIYNYINENLVETRVETGERTYAAEDLQSEIERIGYTTNKEDSAMSYNPYYDSEKEVLLVPNRLVSHVIANYDTIIARDLQVELDQRPVNDSDGDVVKLGNVRQDSVNGKAVRYWPIHPDFVDLECGGEGDE